VPERQKRTARFTISDGDIEVTGFHMPSPEEIQEADAVFDRLLKNKKTKP
jgi:hypothetical protein